MTAQFGEKLIFEGHDMVMFSEPLGDYFALGGNKPEFGPSCTALWRGYVGTWEIVDDRLYMVKLTGTLKDGTEATLETVFPGYPDRVFAHWYSGTLQLPEGELLEYVHMGYSRTFERDHLLKIRNGILVGSHVRHNDDDGDGDSPEEYGSGAMSASSKSTGNGDDTQ